MAKSAFSKDDDALLAELGVDVEAKKKAKRTPKEERIIAGFEEIQRFVDEHGRAPAHGEERDIFERLYAVRLDRIREQAECRELVEELDHQGLLGDQPIEVVADDIDDEALLAELGVEREASDLAQLKHVRSTADRKAAEEIADRTKCEDFDKFKPLFERLRDDLDKGRRETRPVTKDSGFVKADINIGQFFVLGGQIAYVASVGERIKAPNGDYDARLRVIYDNGTESDLLQRSLQRALYKDEAGRRITEAEAGPLFSSVTGEDDEQSGTIYVLRSKSNHPTILANRDLIHKIGVTGGDVKKRIANAKNDATYLLADVEVVATYELYNINRTKLEKLIHKFFDAARLDIEIKDRFGNPVSPREWFMVPLFVIDEMVTKLTEGNLDQFRFDTTRVKIEALNAN
ncbi:MAG: GIY-YIG nuclease family protein [Alphaproteobacteria bacterium]